MKKWTKDEINEAVRLHCLWRIGDEKGVRANLCDANLCDANLRGADLSGAEGAGHGAVSLHEGRRRRRYA